MIAKCIIRKSDKTDFKRLAAYVLNEKDGGNAHPLDWKLADYVMDRGGAGEKVASHRITNCISTDPGWAVAECLVLAAQNTRATKDKSYHLVISFPEGERPTNEQMADIEDTLVNAAGFEGHKRISAVHQNTDNWHLHVAIVTVHPKTLRNVTPYYDHYRLQEACEALEIKHNLTRTRHSPSPQRALNGKASALEAHAGRISFSRWVMENAAKPLTAEVAAAHSWAEVHAAMANYGVEIKLRGAGLVVANQTDTRSAMKASDIDRSLSFKALTDRLGPFEPAAAILSGKEPAMRYTGVPHGAEPGLWERYRQERQAATEARQAALASLKAGHIQYAQDLNVWYRKRHAAAKTAHLNRGDRISTRRVLETEFAADHAKRKAREIEDRKAVKAGHKIPAWEDFLTREGSRGDQAAMKTLERRVEALIKAEAELTRADQNRDRGAGQGRA